MLLQLESSSAEPSPEFVVKYVPYQKGDCLAKFVYGNLCAAFTSFFFTFKQLIKILSLSSKKKQTISSKRM